MINLSTRFVLVLVLAATVLMAESVVFRFAPPEGDSQVVTKRHARAYHRHEKGAETVQTDVSETKVRTAAAKSDGGYVIVSETLTSTLSRNEHDIASPMLEAMKGLKLTYTISGEGQLESIEGYRGVLENLKTKFPPVLMQTIGPLFNEQSLREQDKAEWQDRIGQFVGKTAEVGKAWTETEQYPLPTRGRIELHKATIFERWVDCAESRCLQLRYIYHTDSAELAKLANQVAKGAMQLPPDPEQAPPKLPADITGEGTRVIDPATMKIYSEKITRTLQMKSKTPDQGVPPIKVVETREYIVETNVEKETP